MTRYEALTDLAIERMGRHVQVELDTKSFIKKLSRGFREYLQCPEPCFRCCNVDKHLQIVRQVEKLEPHIAADGFSYVAIDLRLARYRNDFVDAWFLLGVRKSASSTFVVRFSFMEESQREDTTTDTKEGFEVLYGWLFERLKRDFQRPIERPTDRFGFSPA